MSIAIHPKNGYAGELDGQVVCASFGTEIASGIYGMASVNKVILVGNVGKDPEIRTMQNGGRVASLSVATSDTWRDKATGERKEKTEWHRVSVFNDGLVGVIERFVKKGTKVYIEGALETRKWTDQSGQERYTTEVTLKAFRGELVLLDGPSGGRSEGPSSSMGGYDNNSEPDYGMSAPASRPASAGRPAPISDLDDEVPF